MLNPQNLKECFIVSGGSSLCNFDWRLLDDKFTIAVNMSYIKLPNANIIYCTDPPWINDNATGLSNHRAPVYQGALNLENPPRLPCVDKQWLLTGVTGLETKPNSLRHGQNSTYAAVNMAAVHLGFKKICLLGVDMKWGTANDIKTSHWHSATYPHKRSDGEAIYTKMIQNFQSIKQPLLDMGVEVININKPENTNLDVFQIKSVKEIFKE